MAKELRLTLEQRAQARREFMQWARIEIADSVISHGFRELPNVIERIVHSYMVMQEKHNAARAEE